MKNLIESNLQQLNIDYEHSSPGPGKHSYYFTGNFEEFSASFAITINKEDEYLFYYIKYPYEIAEERITHVSEYINRINFADVFGAFVIDYGDNSLGYHLSIPIAKHREENDDRLAVYLEHGYDIVDEYHDGLLKVANDGRDPLEVLTEMGVAVTQVN